LILFLNGPPLLIGEACRFASARFWLIITKVERKLSDVDGSCSEGDEALDLRSTLCP
jgi:hypothetical protein